MDMDAGTKKLIRLYALQNAVFHQGKANAGAVIGRTLAEMPALRNAVAETGKAVAETLKEVNKLGLAQQQAELERESPEMMHKEKKTEDMPELQGAVEGKVVTRFAPAPTGPLTIFHLMRAAFLSYYYARRYHGKFVLRLEDSDPVKVKAEFYDFIVQDLKAVGIDYDEIVLESSHMDLYYKHAEKMISAGKAYVCSCPAEAFRALKEKKNDCACRKKSAAENATQWKAMLSGAYKQGDIVLRLRTSMSEPNPVLRDPPLFRICDTKHPKVGTKYMVWPLYNFACAVEDHLSGVTHVFRAKEHEHNTAVQRLVYDFFGWTKPAFINFGLVYFPGTKMHKRDIKSSMDKGIYTGWDDPQLPTVRAFLRRGFLPKTFEALAKTCGLSKNDIRIGWENLEGINRKLLDPIANRYMVVIDPVRIELEGQKLPKNIEMEKHPDFPERGARTLPVDAKEVYVAGTDFEKLHGKPTRLIGVGNFTLEKKSKYIGDEIMHGMQKIQFVSVPNVPIEILMPDGTKVTGLGEAGMANLHTGETIQMNRIGFARVDSTGKTITLVFTHK